MPGWDESANEYRYRIREPELFLRLRINRLKGIEGVYQVGGPLKSDPDGPWKVQSVRFKKKNWTLAEAKKWVNEHKADFNEDFNEADFSEDFSEGIDFGEGGETNWIPIFRAGDYGIRGSWTTGDLDRVVKNHDPSFHDAPLAIGHPKNESPAFGWASRLRRNGELLEAKFRNVSDSFRKLWNEKKFNKLSASFYYNLNGRGPALRHVGALGAIPPEVKGLPQASFREDDNSETIELTFNLGNEVEFTDMQSNSKGGDNVLTKEEVQKMLDAALKTQGETLTASFSEEIGKRDGKIADLTSKLEAAGKPDDGKKKDGADDKGAQFSEEAMAELRKERETNQKLVSEIRLRDHADFVEGLIKQGRILPKEKDGIVELMMSMDIETPVEFGEGGKTVKMTQLDALKKRLASQPKIINFDELSIEDGKGSSVDFAEKTAGSLFDEKPTIFTRRGIDRETLIKYAHNMALR